MTERFPTDNDMQCAWDDYVEAKRVAEKTMNLNDGIEAGRMWRRFIQLFERPGHKPIDNNVSYLPRECKRSYREVAL